MTPQCCLNDTSAAAPATLVSCGGQHQGWGGARVEKEVLQSVRYSLIQHQPVKSKLTLRNKCQNIKHDKRNTLHVCKCGILGLLNPDVETLVPKSIDMRLRQQSSSK